MMFSTLYCLSSWSRSVLAKPPPPELPRQSRRWCFLSVRPDVNGRKRPCVKEENGYQ